MREQLLVSVFCLVIALGGVILAAWLLIGGAVATQGIDPLFLALVCLLVALIFSVVPLQAYRQGLFRGLLARERHAAAPKPRPAENPKAQETPEGREGA